MDDDEEDASGYEASHPLEVAGAIAMPLYPMMMSS